jgi:poly(A) polymerase Pap1
MRKCGLFESDVDMHKRLEVLRRINAMVKKWVKDVSVDKVCAILF